MLELVTIFVVEDVVALTKKISLTLEQLDSFVVDVFHPMRIFVLH